MRIPFVQIFLFPVKAVPSVRTLSSPMVYYGAVGDLTFIDKKTGEPEKPESPALTINNLCQYSPWRCAEAGRCNRGAVLEAESNEEVQTQGPLGWVRDP